MECFKTRKELEKKAKNKIKEIEKHFLKNTCIGDMIKVRVKREKSAFFVEYWLYHDSFNTLQVRTNALFDEYKWVQGLDLRGVFKIIEVEKQIYTAIDEQNQYIINKLNDLGVK